MQSAADLRIPHVWRVTDLAREEAVLPSGHASLDAQLPGGGWPLGSLIEVLQARPELHAWQLVLPALAARVSDHAGPMVLVGAPCEPFTPSLAAQGLPAEQLLWIRADAPAARLWSAEQALRCAEVAGVLAWLPQCRAADLRRLQLAGRQHGKLLFAFRPASTQVQASPSPLRLLVDGVDDLQVRVLKRKGPPMQESLHLHAHPARLRALLASRRRSIQPVPAEERRSHVLDRLVTTP
ncbi:translesion DNA synthesis-associated protein ImuA [Ramlibacter algicola]|uniref:Translesion DNA synthesis-associated protein ImuA n=1 Tax=Ramlibacter algicola TaxID=2795217 RepID=A0A934URP3_9BURK|nr:translesion DNA synthesis-associated protein ImuA [Ramlibacter algicola]MBK0392903.1 translesion DNA synthesis-associated protein ImuA [Ramlibacter algicola]